MTGRLLRARDVAVRLDLSTETVLRWTRDGRLPGYRISTGALRYDEDELDIWLAEHATGAASREVSATRIDRAQDGAYGQPGVGSPASASPPPDAAESEEDQFDATH
jgi:excisionase family DNA binding protein